MACSLVAAPRTSAITVSTLLTRTNCVRTASELLAVAAVWCTTASGACLQLVANKDGATVLLAFVGDIAASVSVILAAARRVVAVSVTLACV